MLAGAPMGWQGCRLPKLAKEHFLPMCISLYVRRTEPGIMQSAPIFQKKPQLRRETLAAGVVLLGVAYRTQI